MRLRSGTSIDGSAPQIERSVVDSGSRIGTGNNNSPGTRRSGNHEIIPHSNHALGFIYLFFGFLITMFFIAPVIVRSCPWILKEVAFLNRLRWPPSVNLSAPADNGLLHTRHFNIPSADSYLGAWHILPHHFHKIPSEDSQYANLLGQGQPIMLYLHGNAGTRAAYHRMQLYKVLAKTGFHVIAIDYRGYGDSPGSPSEEGLGEDAYAAFSWIKQHSLDSQLFIWGHSLGSGVATKVAKRICDQGMTFDGLILESPFNNFLDAAERHPLARMFVVLPWYTWGFAESFKYNNISFKSDESISSVTVPTLIMHAEDDGIVPYELGEKLYKAALKTKHIGKIDFVSFDAGHGYGHKHIHKAPELPTYIRDFMGMKTWKSHL